VRAPNLRHRPVLEPIGCRNEANFSCSLPKPLGGSHLRQSIDLYVVLGDAFDGESPLECLPNFDAIERADAPHSRDRFGNIVDQKTCDAVVDDLGR
jgi:hypothetical protein